MRHYAYASFCNCLHVPRRSYGPVKLIIKQRTNNVNHILTSVNKLLLLHETINAKLHTPLLTISSFFIGA